MSAPIRIDRPHRPTRAPDDRSRTYGELLIHRAAATPDTPAHFEKGERGWQAISWRAFDRRAAAVAAGLERLGIAIGDRIAVLGPTSVAWADFDLGGAYAGTPVFGIYPRQSADQVRFLLEDSQCRVVFVAEEEELETLIAAASGLDSLVAIVPWSTALFARFEDADPRVTSPEVFAGEPMTADDVAARQDRIEPDDPAVLIYTSGTTGRPKGAVLSHRNLVAFAESLDAMRFFFEDDLLLSFLPMAHVSERVFGFVGRIHAGVPAAYATSIGAVIAELPEVGPTVFGSVPRIYEKAYDKVQGGVARAPMPVRALFDWALRVGRRRAARVLEGRPVPNLLALKSRLAHRLVYHKVHAAFGGRVRMMVCGAAPISRDVLDFFWATDLPIFEAYGLTEASGGTHINLPGAVRLGSVGRPLPNLEHRIADDGEVLLRGDLIFGGYLGNEGATREALDEDGWLHTGDIGKIEDDFLTITDRKKHLIITAGGKNVAPATIEGAIKGQSPLISQLHAHGDRRPFVSALIAPSPLETLTWGHENGVLEKSRVDALIAELMADPQSRSAALSEAMAEVVARDDFLALFIPPVQRGNRKLARVERVRRFTVLERDFSQEDGELTPTMKMKRKAIEETFRDRFDRLYDDPTYGLDAEAKRAPST